MLLRKHFFTAKKRDCGLVCELSGGITGVTEASVRVVSLLSQKWSFEPDAGIQLV